MAQSTIEARLGEFRRRVRRVLGVHGICWVAAVLIGIVTFAGLSDWLLDLSAGVRVILLGLLAAGTLYTAYRFLFVPLRVPMRDVDLALRVEARHPKFNDQLSSAVEFLAEATRLARPAAAPAGAATAASRADPGGSATLKQAVVDQTSRLVQAVDFGTALDTAPTRRAASLAGVTLALAAALVIASPGSARIAIARLVDPFGKAVWPRDTHLAIVSAPTKLARGEPFRLTVAVSSGRVPPRADVHYEFEGGERSTEPLRPAGDVQFTGGIEAATRSFDFHVRAGDGITESRHVEVVPPPELASLRLRLAFPAYTAQPDEELPEGKGHVRAVWGTKVELAGRATKPLARAELRFGNDDEVAADLDAAGTELRAAFTLEKTGSYWIALEDRDGFTNREASRYEVRVIEDQPPEVFVERPASDIEVTPAAVVPIRAVVKDDFGIADVALEFSTSASDAESKTEVSLWHGDDRPRRQVAEHSWHIAELKLTPGSSVTYRVTARDADDLRGPHVGTSRQLRLLVVTAEDLAKRIEDRQLALFQELDRVRKIQFEARSQVNELREQLRTQPSLSKVDVARLQTAEANQRQIARRLASPTEGLQSQVAQLQNDLANNQVQNAPLEEQLASLASGLDRITTDELPQIEQGLTRARKAADERSGEQKPGARNRDVGKPQSQSDDPAAKSETAAANAANSESPDAQSASASKSAAASKSASAKSAAAKNSSGQQPSQGAPSENQDNAADPQRAGLAEAQEHQDNVLASLDEMLERMSKWETYRGIARDAKELLDRQEQVAKETRETGEKTIGQKRENLSPEQQAELSKLAARQQQAREQLERLERKMEQMGRRLGESDPAAAATLNDAVEASRAAGTGEQMQRASSAIAQNQVGSAEAAQQRATDDLKQMLDTLENSRERDLAKLAEQLKEAESKLNDLKARQTEQLERTKDAGEMQSADERRRELERLARQEKEMQQETSRLAQQLRRMRADQASRSSSSASSRMGQAGQQMEQDDAAQSQAEQKKVLEDLEKARREVAQQRKEIEAQLAMEQLVKIADTLASLHERQKAVKEETVRLETVRAAAGWTRSQLQSLRTAAQAEDAVRDDSEKAREVLNAAPVFALTLGRAITSMERAAAGLGERRADADVQSAEQAAIDRIAQLLDALKQDPRDPADSENGEDKEGEGKEGEQQNQQQRPRDGIPAIAQLKMLRSLQIEINERTSELAELERARKLSPAQQKELGSLSEEQGTLADLIQSLIKPPPEEGDKE